MEVRYEYEAPGRIGLHRVVFGSDWDSAFDRFKQEAAANSESDGDLKQGCGLLLEKSRTLLESCRSNREQNEQLVAKLTSYLNRTLVTYKNMDDPRYQRDQTILNRIADKASGVR